MQVKQGWSGEVDPNKWAKITVELDEGDLGRILRQAGLNVQAERLPVITAYSLLEVEAEKLILMKLIIRHGYPQDQGGRELAEFEQARIALLDQVRALAPA